MYRPDAARQRPKRNLLLQLTRKRLRPNTFIFLHPLQALEAERQARVAAQARLQELEAQRQKEEASKQQQLQEQLEKALQRVQVVEAELEKRKSEGEGDGDRKDKKHKKKEKAPSTSSTSDEEDAEKQCIRTPDGQVAAWINSCAGKPCIHKSPDNCMAVCVGLRWRSAQTR